MTEGGRERDKMRDDFLGNGDIYYRPPGPARAALQPARRDQETTFPETVLTLCFHCHRLICTYAKSKRCLSC